MVMETACRKLACVCNPVACDALVRGRKALQGVQTGCKQWLRHIEVHTAQRASHSSLQLGLVLEPGALILGSWS